MDLDLFAIRSQIQPKTHKRQHNKWGKKNQITNIVEMKICIYQTIVEFSP